MAKAFAISGNSDQMPHSAASDLGLHCLPVTQTTMGYVDNPLKKIRPSISLRIKLISTEIIQRNIKPSCLSEKMSCHHTLGNKFLHGCLVSRLSA